MTDNLDGLESELAAMRPRALSHDLVARIEDDLAGASSPSKWPDRFLVSAIGAGAIAACVIVAMLLKPMSDGLAAPAPVLATSIETREPARAGDFSLAVARADGLTFGP